MLASRYVTLVDVAISSKERPMSTGATSAGVVLAMDGIGVIGTIGFALPAGIVVALVVGAVVRDRRRERAEDDLGPVA